MVLFLEGQISSSQFTILRLMATRRPETVNTSDGSGSKNLIGVGSGQYFIAQVRLGQPYLVWVWKILPKNLKFFNFCPSDKKSHRVGSKIRRPLIYCASKVCLGWVRAHLYTKHLNQISLNSNVPTIQLWPTSFH